MRALQYAVAGNGVDLRTCNTVYKLRNVYSHNHSFNGRISGEILLLDSENFNGSLGSVSGI